MTRPALSVRPARQPISHPQLPNADFHNANRPPSLGSYALAVGTWRIRREWRSHSITPVARDHCSTGTDLLQHELHGYGLRCHLSTRAVDGGVIREKDEESAGHPPAMRRPAARPDAKRLHNDIARRSSAAFPSVSRSRSLAAKIGANRHDSPQPLALGHYFGRHWKAGCLAPAAGLGRLQRRAPCHRRRLPRSRCHHLRRT